MDRKNQFRSSPATDVDSIKWREYPSLPRLHDLEDRLIPQRIQHVAVGLLDCQLPNLSLHP